MSDEKSIESQEQKAFEYYFVEIQDQIQESQLALQKSILIISTSHQQLYQLPDCFERIRMNMTRFKFWKVGHEILALLPFKF